MTAILILLLVAGSAVVAAVATIRAISRDGYGRVATRCIGQDLAERYR